MLFSEPYFRPENGIRILMLIQYICHYRWGIRIHVIVSSEKDTQFSDRIHEKYTLTIQNYQTTPYRIPTQLKAAPGGAECNLAFSPNYIRTREGCPSTEGSENG